MRTAFVAPNKKWDVAEMARVMPRQRDPTHKPTFIPLLYGSWGEAEELIHMEANMVQAYPCGFVFIPKTNEPDTPTAELPLFWLPEDMELLKKLAPPSSFAILFRKSPESGDLVIPIQGPVVTQEPDVPHVTQNTNE